MSHNEESVEVRIEFPGPAGGESNLCLAVGEDYLVTLAQCAAFTVRTASGERMRFVRDIARSNVPLGS